MLKIKGALKSFYRWRIITSFADIKDRTYISQFSASCVISDVKFSFRFF